MKIDLNGISRSLNRNTGISRFWQAEGAYEIKTISVQTKVSGILRFHRVNGDSATLLAMNAEMTEVGGGSQREDLERVCGGDGEGIMEWRSDMATSARCDGKGIGIGIGIGMMK